MKNWQNKFVEIIDDYIDDAKETVKLLKEKYKHDINDPDKSKKYIIIASSLLVLTILIANIFNSFAYYYNESEGYTIINATVGEMYINDYDYTLLIFLESGNQKDFYELADEIPSTGYTYNGYSCLNDTKLSYNDSGKITSSTLTQKDVCSVYFKVNK